MEKIEECPICETKDQQLFLECTDYTVSNEQFKIVNCNGCGFKFTNPRPEEQKIGAYYQSEEYVSHSNTSKGVVNSLYQLVRKYTLSQKFKLVAGLSKGKSILDYGSGTGDFLNFCKKNGWNTQGMEPDEGARRMSIERFGLNVISPLQIKTLHADSFDIITLWHVLEHVHQLKPTLASLVGSLKKEGKLLIAVPNYTSFDARFYQKHWAAYDVPRHLYHFSPHDISRLMEQFNMKVVKTLPMVFDAYYVSMLSEKYKTGSGNLFSAFVKGMQSNLKSKGKNEFSSQIYILEKNKAV